MGGELGRGSGGWQQKLTMEVQKEVELNHQILTLAEDAAATPIIAMAAAANNRKQADIYFNE
jgi:hypothetical protein